MKRYLSILMIVAIILSLPLSVNSDNNIKPSIVKLNLEQAYKMIETNNLEIKLMDKRMEINKVQYDKALEEALDAKEMISSNRNTNMEYRRKEAVNPKLAKLEFDELLNERAEKLESLKSTTKQQYINILLIQRDIEFLKGNIENIDKDLYEVELRIKLGQAKELDYKTLMSQKLSLQNQLNALNTQIESSKVNLKKTIGMEISQAIELEELVLPYQALDRVNIKDNITKAIDNNFSVYRLKKELECKKLEIDLYREYTNYENLAIYNDLLIEFNQIEAELNYEKMNVEASLWIDYYELLQLEDNIKLEEVNLEIDKINYDTIAAKFKLGMVNTVTELNSSIEYYRQKNNYQRAMYNYILAAEQFNRNLSVKR